MGVQLHVEEFKVSLGPAGEVAEHPVVPPLLGLGEDLLPPDQGGGGLRPLHEAGVGDLEAVGDFPEGVDGGVGVPLFQLREHGLADPRQGRELPQGKAPLRAQLF